MSNSTGVATGPGAEQKTPSSLGSGHGELLHKDLRCSECGGVLPAGTPISRLLWDRESRRFKHAPPCSAQGTTRHGSEESPTAACPQSLALAQESPGEPGPYAGRDWARIGFTLRLAEYESLRAEVALYSALDEADAKFTERLRESLLLKVQEALAAVEETREMVHGRVRA
ncbi:MAG: hypothetical protein WAN74_06360 [Thermoplasmata archaeon]